MTPSFAKSVTCVQTPLYLIAPCPQTDLYDLAGSMVFLKLKDPLQLFVKRAEFISGSRFLSETEDLIWDIYFSHSEVYFTVKDLWSPMGVLQRGQKVKLM